MEAAFETFERLFNQHALAVITIVVAAYLGRKIVMKLVTRVVQQSVRAHHKYADSEEDEKREKTIIDIFSVTLRFAIWVVAGLMILEEVGVNTAPLLAGAGVLGVALGFGAQSVVKDALNGLLIIFENQYRVGDVVMVNNDLAGVVEKITLRETVMRDLDGMVHHIPNGFINTATNMTMEFANVNFDIGVSYDTDIAHAEKIVNQVGAELAADKEWRESIIEPPAFLRIEDFADSAIIIKILGKTTSDKRWAVAGELRKRIKIAFDENDIEIPFPQMVIHEQKKKQASSGSKK